MLTGNLQKQCPENEGTEAIQCRNAAIPTEQQIVVRMALSLCQLWLAAAEAVSIKCATDSRRLCLCLHSIPVHTSLKHHCMREW